MENFTPAIFSGSDLACRRGGRTVFAGLGFSLKSGEALVLRGANGSGKSSLLRIMAGLGQHSRGQLAWNGDAVADPEAHGARLRFVGHLDAVKPALTVAENLSFWRSLWGGEHRTDEDIHRQRCSRVRPRSPFLVSRRACFRLGQRHRLALARLAARAGAAVASGRTGQCPRRPRAERSGQRVIAAHRTTGGMVVMASHGAAGMDNARTSRHETASPHRWKRIG